MKKTTSELVSSECIFHFFSSFFVIFFIIFVVFLKCLDNSPRNVVSIVTFLAPLPLPFVRPSPRIDGCRYRCGLGSTLFLSFYHFLKKITCLCLAVLASRFKYLSLSIAIFKKAKYKIQLYNNILASPKQVGVIAYLGLRIRRIREMILVITY